VNEGKMLAPNAVRTRGEKSFMEVNFIQLAKVALHVLKRAGKRTFLELASERGLIFPARLWEAFKGIEEVERADFVGLSYQARRRPSINAHLGHRSTELRRGLDEREYLPSFNRSKQHLATFSEIQDLSHGLTSRRLAVGN
jgi:hypothetical protein